MIRAVSIASLLCLLVLVLYLPSAYAPGRFVDLVRQEQASIEIIWSRAAALRILARAVAMTDTVQGGSPVPQPSSGARFDTVDHAVANEMASVNQRLFDSTYFRSMDALLLLASFRLAALLEWLPWLLAFGVACVVDGALVRRIKAREFRQHDPEWFAIHASLGIVTVCTIIVSFVLPRFIHPLLVPCAPVLMSFFAGRTLGCLHFTA